MMLSIARQGTVSETLLDLMSDSEEFRSNKFEDAGGFEEIQILQSSENNLFAAISKQIKLSLMKRTKEMI